MAAPTIHVRDLLAEITASLFDTRGTGDSGIARTEGVPARRRNLQQRVECN
jgi:hypothetical protein